MVRRQEASVCLAASRAYSYYSKISLSVGQDPCHAAKWQDISADYHGQVLITAAANLEPQNTPCYNKS